MTGQTTEFCICKHPNAEIIAAGLSGSLLLWCETTGEQCQSLIRNEKHIHQRHNAQTSATANWLALLAGIREIMRPILRQSQLKKTWRFSLCIPKSGLASWCDPAHFHHSQVLRKTGNHQSSEFDFPNATVRWKYSTDVCSFLELQIK